MVALVGHLTYCIPYLLIAPFPSREYALYSIVLIYGFPGTVGNSILFILDLVIAVASGSYHVITLVTDPICFNCGFLFISKGVLRRMNKKK
jgi:hypothetical protein